MVFVAMNTELAWRADEGPAFGESDDALDEQDDAWFRCVHSRRTPWRRWGAYILTVRSVAGGRIRGRRCPVTLHISARRVHSASDWPEPDHPYSPDQPHLTRFARLQCIVSDRATLMKSYLYFNVASGLLSLCCDLRRWTFSMDLVVWQGSTCRHLQGCLMSVCLSPEDRPVEFVTLVGFCTRWSVPIWCLVRRNGRRIECRWININNIPGSNPSIFCK